MDTKNLFFEENHLFNRYGLDIVCYYDPCTNTFEMLDSFDEIGDELIETPYLDNYRWLVWEKFWDILSEEERCLAESFTERRGFFQFLRETGLIDRYNKAEELSKKNIIERWEAYNGLSVDWTSARVN